MKNLKSGNYLTKVLIKKKLSSNITKSSIKYNYYNKLERYAILRGTNWTKSKRESFYDFRDDINLNDTDLSLFDPYVTFFDELFQ